MIPSCDHTGVSHFHSSTMAGSASWMSVRTRASFSPRQSRSSRIRFVMSSEARDFFTAFFSPIVFHDDHWNIDLISPDRRALDLTESSSIVKVASIESSLEPNRALILRPSQGNSVLQDRRADALTNFRRIDVDGDHRSSRRLAKTDNATAPLGTKRAPRSIAPRYAEGVRFASQPSMMSA